MTKAYLQRDNHVNSPLSEYRDGIQGGRALCPGCTCDTSLGKWSFRGVEEVGGGVEGGRGFSGRGTIAFKSMKTGTSPVAQCSRP